MKTLYVHIGMPKTATSALQGFLRRNREAFKKKNYCCPPMRRYGDKSISRNGLFLVEPPTDADGTPIEDTRRDFREGMKKVARLFEQYDNVILTDEVIWLKTYKEHAQLWEELKAEGQAHGYTVKIIVYLRRQDQFVSSWRNQLVKLNAGSFRTRDWEDYYNSKLSRLQLDYYQKLKSIEAVLGKENLIIRIFDRAEFYGGSIFADFLHVIGLEFDEDFSIGNEIVNISLNGNSQEFKRIINKVPGITFDENVVLRAALAEASEIAHKERPTAMFSAQEASDFVNRFADSNQKVAQEYLGRDALFSDKYKEVTKWEKDNPYVTEDLILFMGTMNLQLIRMLQENQRQIEELRKEVKALDSLKKAMKHPLKAGAKLLLGRNKD